MTEGFTGTEGLAGAAAGEGNSPEFSQGQEPQQQGGNNHPAWGDLLGALPEGLHTVVKPYLEKWDTGVQQKFQEVHSQYAPFKPFLENEVDPQVLSQAYDLYNLINTDPERVYKQMQAAFGFGSEQGQQEQQSQADPNSPFDFGEGQEDSQFDIENHPKFKELQQQLEQVSNSVQAKYEEELQQQVDQELSQEIDSLYERHGLDPNDSTAEEFALGLAMAGMPLDKAFDKYMEIRQQVLQSDPNRTAPRVLPASGGVPSSRIDPAQLKDGETKQLLANLIKQANEQG